MRDCLCVFPQGSTVSGSCGGENGPELLPRTCGELNLCSSREPPVLVKGLGAVQGLDESYCLNVL